MAGPSNHVRSSLPWRPHRLLAKALIDGVFSRRLLEFVIGWDDGKIASRWIAPRAEKACRLRGLPCFADPSNLTQPEEPVAPIGQSGLALLQTVYRDPLQPLGVRLRAAIEALPFEAPKLAAVAVGHMSGEDFATRLDRAIVRSARAPKTIDVEPEQRPVGAVPVIDPVQRLASRIKFFKYFSDAVRIDRNAPSAIFTAKIAVCALRSIGRCPAGFGPKADLRL